MTTKQEREFMECDTCRAKAGSPVLCRGCLHNRDLISKLTAMPHKKKSKKEGVLGTWHMGHIALFGAILMSRGIIGKDKEMLKKMMYRALTAPNQIITNNN